MRRLLAQVADLVLPVRCLGCRARAIAWCEPCRSAALSLRIRVLEGAMPVVAAASYDADVREAVLGYKDHGRRDLGASLAELLSASVAAARDGLQRPLIVPMPSRAAASRDRGGDHMERLVRRLPTTYGEPAVLLGTRQRVDATSLSAVGRRSARRAAMYARPGAGRLVDGRDVLLVDDIVTTGSTLARAGEILHALGARQMRAAVIAETERQVSAR